MSDKVVTGGKPFQSKLAPYEAEIKELKSGGASIRGIAAEMLARHGLAVSHNAVASFMKTHGVSRKGFLDGIQETRKRELLKQLRAVWTHDSTISANSGTTSTRSAASVADKASSFRNREGLSHCAP